MNFAENVLFAATMAALEQHKEEMQEKEKRERQSADSRVTISKEYRFNVESEKNRIFRMGKALVKNADRATGVTSDIDVEEITKGLVCSLIFTALQLTDTDEDMKLSVCETAKRYGSDLFADAEAFVLEEEWAIGTSKEFLSSGLMMFITAGSVADDLDSSMRFVFALSDYLQYVESEIDRRLFGFNFVVNPSALLIDKTVECLERKAEEIKAEHPEVAENEVECDYGEMTEIRNSARKALENKNYPFAAMKYKKLLELDSDNWEAKMFEAICDCYMTDGTVFAQYIISNTSKIGDLMTPLMKRASEDLMPRLEVLTILTQMTTQLIAFSSDCFVSAMNDFKSKGKTAETEGVKNIRVNAVIQMLFRVGDSIEQYFGNNENASQLFIILWSTAFTCFENCNMRIPEGAREHYEKLVRYEPGYRCKKSLTIESFSSQAEGCYIATCVYGSYDCPQVWMLRRFRDDYLRQSAAGRIFVRFYYAISPWLVKVFGEQKLFKALCKKPLEILLHKLHNKGVSDTQYNDN